MLIGRGGYIILVDIKSWQDGHRIDKKMLGYGIVGPGVPRFPSAAEITINVCLNLIFLSICYMIKFIISIKVYY